MSNGAHCVMLATNRGNQSSSVQAFRSVALRAKTIGTDPWQSFGDNLLEKGFIERRNMFR